MQENSPKKKALSRTVKNESNIEHWMSSIVDNDEYEIITGVPEKFFCETIGMDVSNKEDIRNNTESLESFYECPENFDKKWIEGVQKDSSALKRWLKQTSTAGDSHNVKGEAFGQCPLPHPLEELPSKQPDRYEGSRNPNLKLEATLCRISKAIRGKFKSLRIDTEKKFRPDVANEGSFMHAVPPSVAIENYCQQHAYSRTRLLRTDRRELANELLENISTDTADILLAPSPRSASTLIPDTSPFFPQSLNKKTATLTRPIVVDQVSVGASNLNCYENLKTNDHNHLYDSVSYFSDETSSAISKETGDCKTAQRNAFVLGINEPLKITPCVLFPSEAPTESRNRISRKLASVPRYIPKLVN